MNKSKPENIVTVDDLDFELYFVTEVLKLDSLHYGYWKKEWAPTLENMRLAQKEYTDTLLSLIPTEVRNVLDVGSGIGDNASAMSRINLRVSAISPDKNHKKYYPIDSSIKFYNTKLEDFDTTDQFDLILMSESHNYFDAKLALEKTSKLLHPNGYLLVSGIFNLGRDQTLADIHYTELEYTAIATSYGLELIERIDITDNTLPTLEIAYEFYTRYFLPTQKMFNKYLILSARYKWKILSWLFSKQLKQLSRWESYYENRLSPATFKNNAQYLRLLFKNTTH